MPFQTQIRQALTELEAAGLLRRPLRISGPQGPEIEIDGHRVLCLCSNNYLGLADHRTIVAASEASARQDGVGAGASRLITGTMGAHEEAELAFAEFIRAPAAALFSTGYAANVGTVQALVGPGDAVFSDALNHASLIDGCRLSRATVHVYSHRDVQQLESLMREHRPRAGRALIITDSLFSMDGVRAPLRDLATLASSFDAGLLVDEAHALGVLGPAGRGLAAAEGIEPDVIVGTLGKAFADELFSAGKVGWQGPIVSTFGLHLIYIEEHIASKMPDFVAASEDIVSLVRNTARSFVYSTAPPPMNARAAIAALGLVREADAARATLLAHADRLRSELRKQGFDVPNDDSHILPVLVGDNERTMQLSAKLLDRGIFVQGIRPPTVPEGTARLRVTPMATHRPEHIERAIGAFASLARND